MTVLRHPNNQGVTLQQWRKTAAGGETSLSGTDDFSAALAYTVGAEQVFVNGVLIERGVDYTATTGTTVTGLTALVAGDIVTVSSPSAFNVANAIPKATVTAKGDVIVGTGASTITNLAVGSDGSTLVANSSASTGVSWAGNIAAGRNGVLNGGMDIWQRGSSVAISAGSTSSYTADRWAGYHATSDSTVSRQSSGISNIQYCARVQRNSSGTSTGLIALEQSLETAESIRFTGQTVTLSFYARAGANYSSASNALSVNVLYGTGTDQSIVAGFTGTGTVISQTATLTTSWVRFTYTGTVSSSSTQIGLQFYYTPSGTAGAADYFEVTGVQLEVGSVATPFSRAGGTLQGELAACQRYYQTSWGSNNTSGAGGGGVSAFAINTTEMYGGVFFRVEMRTNPTVTIYDDASTAGTISLPGVTNGLSATAGRIQRTGFTYISGSGYTANKQATGSYKAEAEL